MIIRSEQPSDSNRPKAEVRALDFIAVKPPFAAPKFSHHASTDHAYGGAPGHQHARRINFWPASACAKSPRPRSFFHLTFDESEKVGVDPLRIDDCDTVSSTLVDLQDCVRNDRWYAAASRTDRHDLIVFAVYDE